MKTTIIMCLLLAVVSIMATGCSSCQSGNEKQDKQETAYHDYDGVTEGFTAGAEHIQALHRETMTATLGIKDYEWRNSRVLFDDDITLENIDALHVTDVNDVFFYHDNGPWVQYINSSAKNGTQIPWPIQDVWIEDMDMSDDGIRLTVDDALQRLKEWNGTLPPGCKSIVLRHPLGPVPCNPQYVLGTVCVPVFIDAMTGDITDRDPSYFPKN